MSIQCREEWLHFCIIDGHGVSSVFIFSQWPVPAGYVCLSILILVSAGEDTENADSITNYCCITTERAHVCVNNCCISSPVSVSAANAAQSPHAVLQLKHRLSFLPSPLTPLTSSHLKKKKKNSVIILLFFFLTRCNPHFCNAQLRQV